MKHASRRSSHDTLEPLSGVNARAVPNDLRALLEPKFQHNLGNIQIFEDQQFARQFGARALTVGSDIVLAEAADNLPTSKSQAKVLTHEIAHAVQHERFGSNQAKTVSQPHDASETEAHTATENALSGLSSASAQTASLQAAPSAAVSLWPEWLSSAASSVSSAVGGVFTSDPAPAAPPPPTPVVAAAPTETVSSSATSSGAVIASSGTATASSGAAVPGAAPAPAPPAVNQEAMDAAAASIFRAVDGIGTDEDAIHAALRGRSPAEAQAIRAAYQAHYGRDLDAELEDELSDTDLAQAQAALSADPVAAAAATLVNAADGVGTNEEAIQQTLRGITDPEQRAAVAAEYQRRTGQSLDDMLSDELSDSDLEISQHLATGDVTGADAAALDAAMHDTTLGVDWGTDEERINSVLEGVTDPEQRQRLLDTYQTRTGHSLSADMTDELSGTELDISARLSEGDRTGAAAARMANAADGLGTDEDTIFRQLEGRPPAEREAIIAAYNTRYGSTMGNFDAMIADEMGEMDGERAHQLADHGQLDPVFALRYAQDGIGTDEDMIRGALRGHSAAEIADIQARYQDATGVDLREDLGSELSGRDEHYIMQMMRGEPANIQERLSRANEDYDFERGSGAGVLGGFTDLFYDAGGMVDAQHDRLGGLQSQLAAATSDAERHDIEAQISRTLGFQSSDVEAYHAAQDAVANNAAMAAAVAAAAAVTIATGGGGAAVAGPMLSSLAASLGVSTQVAAAVLAAAAGGAATMATKTAILGDAYGAEAIGTDAALTLAQMASAGVLSSGTFSAAEGQMSGLQQMIAARGINPTGMGGMLVDRGVQGLVGAGINGTTQAALDENVWRGPGNGVLRFGQILGGSALQNVAGNMVSGTVGHGLESRLGQASSLSDRVWRGGVTGLSSGAAQTAVNSDTWSGHWEDVGTRFAVGMGQNAVGDMASGVGAYRNAQAEAARAASVAPAGGPAPHEGGGPPPPPGGSPEHIPNEPPPPPVTAPEPLSTHPDGHTVPTADFENQMTGWIHEETRDVPASSGHEPLNPADFETPVAPHASSFDPEETHIGPSPLLDGAQTIPDMPAVTATDVEPVTQRMPAVDADNEVTQVTAPRDSEVTRAYTAEEMAQLRETDRQIGIQDTADAMAARFGSDLENFQNLPEARRHEIMEAQNEEMHRRFTADHEGAGRPEFPDVTFMRGADDGQLGQMLPGRNAIELNNESSHNAALTGAEDRGMAGTHAHEFGHVQQERQAANPDGFIDPAYGRQMADNERNYVTPAADYQGYRDQPMESDARTWGQDYNEAVNRSLEAGRQAAVTQEMPAVTAPGFDDEPTLVNHPAVAPSGFDDEVTQVIQRPTQATGDAEPTLVNQPAHDPAGFDDEITQVRQRPAAAREARGSVVSDDDLARRVAAEGREIRGDDIREEARELKRGQITEEVQSGIRSPEIQMLEEDIGRDTLVALADGEIGYSEAGVEVHHKTMLSEAPELGDNLENLEALEKRAHRRGFHDGDFREQRGGIPGNPDFDQDPGFTGLGADRDLGPAQIQDALDAEAITQHRELETLRDTLEEREVPSFEGERERKGRGGPRLTEEEREARETAQTDRGILGEYRRLAASDPRIAAALSALEALLSAE